MARYCALCFARWSSQSTWCPPSGLRSQGFPQMTHHHVADARPAISPAERFFCSLHASGIDRLLGTRQELVSTRHGAARGTTMSNWNDAAQEVTIAAARLQGAVATGSDINVMSEANASPTASAT